MSETPNIQWRPAFCDAMELTLRGDADSLVFEREYNLGSKPLQVDLLVIRKMGMRQLGDQIGRTLRRYNLFEYKSPGDDLNIDSFYKVMAYGCLYKALAGKHVNDVRSNDITLTMVREEVPRSLFKDLLDEGTTVTATYPGIYHLEGNLRFETHVIATRELPEGSYIWLKALTRSIDLTEARSLIVSASDETLGVKERREMEAILDIVAHANADAFARLRRDDAAMDEAMEIIFGDRIEEMDLRNIRNLMDSTKWSADMAMSALKIDPAKRERYARKLSGERGKPANA